MLRESRRKVWMCAAVLLTGWGLWWQAEARITGVGVSTAAAPDFRVTGRAPVAAEPDPVPEDKGAPAAAASPARSLPTTPATAPVVRITYVAPLESASETSPVARSLPAVVPLGAAGDPAVAVIHPVGLETIAGDELSRDRRGPARLSGRIETLPPAR